MNNKRQRGSVSTYKDGRLLFLHRGKRRLSTLAGIESDRARARLCTSANWKRFFQSLFSTAVGDASERCTSASIELVHYMQKHKIKRLSNVLKCLKVNQ